MHAVARFSAKVLKEFGEAFQYGIIKPDDIESDEIFRKAQCLVHFTYILSPYAI